MIKTYLTSKPTYYLLRPWVFFIDLIKETKCFIQRGSRGYADVDLWNLDGYLMEWFPKALRQLANNHIGYPNGLTYKKWTNILNKMANGFEALGIEENLYFSGKKTVDEHILGEKIAIKKLNEALKLFDKHFNDLWD